MPSKSLASETGMMYTAVVHFPDESLRICMNALLPLESVVSWAHDESPEPPVFVDSDSAKIFKECLPFWLLVNNYVKEKDAFVPLKLFKNATQSLYSKTKGCGWESTVPRNSMLVNISAQVGTKNSLTNSEDYLH